MSYEAVFYEEKVNQDDQLSGRRTSAPRGGERPLRQHPLRMTVPIASGLVVIWAHSNILNREGTSIRNRSASEGVGRNVRSKNKKEMLRKKRGGGVKMN